MADAIILFAYRGSGAVRRREVFPVRRQEIRHRERSRKKPQIFLRAPV